MKTKLLLDWSIFNLKMSAILDGNHEQKSQNGCHDSTIKDTNLQWEPNTTKFRYIFNGYIIKDRDLQQKPNKFG